jgi:hypothetical protein
VRLAREYIQNLSNDVKRVYRTWNDYDLKDPLEEVCSSFAIYPFPLT